MSRIRVVFSIGALHGGGSERQLVSLLRHLDRERFEPFLYLVYRSGPLLDHVPADVPIASFDERVTSSRLYLPGLMHARRVRDYGRFLTEVSADVSYDRTFLMTLIAAAGAQRVGVPNISTIVTNPESGFAPVAGRFQSFKRRMLGKLYNRSANVLAVSDGARDAARRFYGIREDRIRTLQNGIDVDWIRHQSEQPVDDVWWNATGEHATQDNTVRIVTAGRLNHEKGFHLLIEAMHLLRTQMPERQFRVAILGEGSHRQQLQAQIQSLGLGSQIRLPGFCDNAAAWYRAADLFVLPSLLEGMPNVLLEAMVCGTPIVSTDCPSGPAEILCRGDLGRLVETGSVAALAEGIRQSLESSHDTAQRAELAAQTAKTEFSIITATRRLEEVLITAATSTSAC